MDTRPGAVVIGGGIVGTLCARELAARGWRVTLLEAAHIGSGSSSRTAAGIRQQFSTPGTVVAMRHSVAFYREFAGGPGAPAIEQVGYLFLHDDPARFERALANVQVQRAAGLAEVEALGADEVAARFPWVDPAAIVGGTWCPTDGFLHPEVVYQEAAAQARALGAEVLQRAPVLGGEVVGGRLVAVSTPRGRFEADLFVDATNAWSPRLARALGAEALPIDPLKRYLWFLNRAPSFDPAWMGRMPLTIAPTGAYCRPENADRLLYGKKYDVAPQPDFADEDQDAIDPAFSHNTGIDAVPYEVWMELAAVMPGLGEFEGVVATTGGFYGTTPDHNPFIGFDRAVGGLLRAVGFSGHGAMIAPFVARAVGALAAAGAEIEAVDLPEGRVELAPFRLGRPFVHAESMVI